MKQKINDIKNKYLFEFILFAMMAVYLVLGIESKLLACIIFVTVLSYYVIFRLIIYNKFDKEETQFADESLHAQEPPDDMHPAVASYFVRETVDLHIVYAVLLSLVNKRKLELNKVEDDYTFTLLDKDVLLLPVDEYVINWLFGDFGTTIKMKDFKGEFSNETSLEKLTERLHKIQMLLHEEVSHLVKDNKEEKGKMKKNLSFVTVGLLIGGFLIIGFPSIMFSLFLYILLLFKITTANQKNAEGAVEYRKWQSYRSFLKQRMDAERRSVNDIILWDYHLTYAVSLGVAAKALDELDWLQGNLVEVMNGASHRVTTR